jgi:hypothetical protein
MADQIERPVTQDAQRIREIASSLTAMRSDLLEDIPGWLVHRPAFAEVDEALAFLVAESKPDDSTPYILPSSAQACISVVTGSVNVHGGGVAIMACNFFVLPAGDDRAIQSLEPNTKIFCLFFRAGVTPHGSDGDNQ